MHEVTCPVYPCAWSVLATPRSEDLAETAWRGHLRSHNADEIVAGFEALTAQNTRQLAHISELNDELVRARGLQDQAELTAEQLAKNNVRLRQQGDRMLSVVNAAREVVALLRLLDELGLSGSVTGPSRSLVVAMADYDATVEVADVRS